MFTTPDQNDASATLPPFSAPGPRADGFFQDCNPAQGFAGTRPLAEHFNEQIVNNRALLAKARIAAVKGDETMLWRAILNLALITQSVTFNVAAGGTVEPADPFAGDPFNSLASALGFLANYRIAPGISVVIQIAPGSFATPSIDFAHPNGAQLTIKGSGVSQTILTFPSNLHGIILSADLFQLQDLTLQGQSTAPAAQPWLAAGLYLPGTTMRLQAVTVAGFAGHGISIGGGSVSVPIGATTTVQNCRAEGVSVGTNGTFNAPISGSVLVVSNCGGLANIVVGSALCTVDEIRCSGGAQGVVVSGSGAALTARKLGVDVATNPAAVEANNGGMMIAATGALLGDWWTWSVAANTPQNFYANGYGFIRTAAALATNNRSNTNPALNTPGNIQAFIQG